MLDEPERDEHPDEEEKVIAEERCEVGPFALEDHSVRVKELRSDEREISTVPG